MLISMLSLIVVVVTTVMLVMAIMMLVMVSRVCHWFSRSLGREQPNVTDSLGPSDLGARGLSTTTGTLPRHVLELQGRGRQSLGCSYAPRGLGASAEARGRVLAQQV